MYHCFVFGFTWPRPQPPTIYHTPGRGPNPPRSTTQLAEAPYDLPHSWRAAKHYTTEEVYLNLITIHDLLTKYGYIYYKNRTLSITLYIYTLFEGWGTCRVVN